MRPAPPLALACAALLWTACKDPQTVAAEERIRNAVARLEQGRAYLDQQRPELAIPELRAASVALRADPMPRVLLARAYREAGNRTAAILALKEAVSLSQGANPALQKQLAELLVQEGHLDAAVPVLLGLRDAKLLTDPEILQLARLQARLGGVDGAFATLEQVQRRRPDDLDAKLCEAELLLARGDAALAGKLLERLVQEHPTLTGARVLRARQLLAAGELDRAEEELDALGPEAATSTDVSALRGELLLAIGRYEEAEVALGHVVEERPGDAEALARLAEVKLLLGSATAAELLVEQSLGAQPDQLRALYVRGRILEEQGKLRPAAEQYARVLERDGAFVPALSRLWRVYRQQDDAVNAMATLERLLFLRKATVEDKVALVELYVQTGSQLARARTLIAEVIAADPESAHLRALQKKIPRATSERRTDTVQVIRGKRR